MFWSTTSDNPTLVELSPQQPEGDYGGKEDRGVAILKLSSLHSFYVSGFKGDSTRDCACGWVSGLSDYTTCLNSSLLLLDPRCCPLSSWKS